MAPIVISHSNEGKFSALRFTQNMTGIDNTLKQRFRVDETYTYSVIDTGAEDSTVTEATSRILSLTLKQSDQVLSGAKGSSLSVLDKSEVLLKNKLKQISTIVYVIKGLQCNLQD